ncbi:hypothetical protein FRZ40_25965 [Paraburkholderia azotifigens]|uniref:Uncharacterized protein n=1 Tax=Paraburkholderia azotifigens TaxID=2057004 RepID=A0A5C6VKW7_9BURK|nr:hypothetical protein FRZ40_25965 [Paraburkholderia azotifigens]
MPVTRTWDTLPSSLLTATALVLFHESWVTLELPVTSFALSPLPLVCEDEAVFDRLLLPPLAFWSHDQSPLEQGLAIA